MGLALKRASAAALLLSLSSCVAPSAKAPGRLDLRVCVEDESLVAGYAEHFLAAVASEPRGGRDCDLTASGKRFNAGKVTLRSAYDGSVLAELDVPVEMAPKLAAFTLARGSEPYRRLVAQRDASGFSR